MFRMSSNLRELINYHIKVYTESSSDSLFYEGIYQSLLNNSKTKIVSKRYNLSFHTVSTKDKEEGSCHEVRKAIKRDINSYKYLLN